MGCYLSWRCLFLVLYILTSMLLSCSSCFMEERVALMDISSSLVSMEYDVPKSWGQSDDCCSWERITCNNNTRRISGLDLSQTNQDMEDVDVQYQWYLNLTIFSSFRELELLNFSGHHADLQKFDGLQGLSKLKYLDLSDNRLQESGILGSVVKLVSLEIINLNGNGMSEDLQNIGFRNLHNLRELHLGSNGLSGSIPASIFALPRLEYLDLSENRFEGLIPVSSSWNLRELHLISNVLSGSLPASLFALPRLEYLDLSDNFLEGLIPINSSQNMRELYLNSNKFSGSVPASLFALPFLEYLDLSDNLFEGHIPINSSWNLRELHLRSNQLSGSVPASVFAPPYLEYLDFSENLLQGHIPINSSWKCSSLLRTIMLSENKLSGKFDFFWLRNCTLLKQIDLSRNTDLVVQVKMHGWIPKFELKTLMLSWCNLDKSIIAEPDFLRTQKHLQFLDLSNNNLPGSMPNWLFTKEPTLVYLDMANNSLVGSLDTIWQHQTNLEHVNVSLNLVEGQLPTNISLMFPNLKVLDVSHNIISGTIPPSLCNIGNITIMDLSNNKFAGEVPSCLFNCSAAVLKLSNNNLGGMILHGASDFSGMWAIYLDNNKFEGTLPRNLSGDVEVMDLHGNKISGGLKTSLWNLPYLQALSLASNGLPGDIHPEICKFTSLVLLDVSDNYFTGRIPNCNTMLHLQFLSVSGNLLSGSPGDFCYSSDITVLDLSHNQFAGNLEWTRYLSQIRVLLLSRNKFEGHTSANLCHLQQLSIIDISNNILSGSIPPCIGGIPFEDPDAYGYNYWPIAGSMTYPEGDYGVGFSYINQYDFPAFTFTTKGKPYTYGRKFFMPMSGIDLSANKLSGGIPKEIGNLTHIKSLNLSNNFLTGSIPTSFANMSEIESLDLSGNRLNGLIPWQLTQLSSLEVFSVAYNNLSGCLPDSGQFGSFDTDCYRGNNNLRSCTSSSYPVAQNGTAGSVPDDSDPILYVVTAISFVLAFWATICTTPCVKLQ